MIKICPSPYLPVDTSKPHTVVHVLDSEGSLAGMVLTQDSHYLTWEPTESRAGQIYGNVVAHHLTSAHMAGRDARDATRQILAMFDAEIVTEQDRKEEQSHGLRRCD